MKYLFIILGSLLGIYLVMCLLGPKDMNVSKSTQIDAPASYVYNLSNQPKLTELWNSFTLGDTTLTTTYNDVTEGIGAESSWESEVTGSGMSKIVESIPNKMVKSEMTFKGWDGVNYSTMSLDEQAGKTTATWSFEGSSLPFLLRAYALVSGMKKQMNSNYTSSLENLKKLAEERVSGLYNGMQIKEERSEERHFIMVRQKVNPKNIQQFYATNLGSLFGKVQSAGIEMRGMPCGLFFNMNPDPDGSLDMAAAIPISNDVTIEGVGFLSITSKDAVVLEHYGDYSTLPNGHVAMEAYMKDRGYLLDYPVIEEYVTDPGQEPDPSKYLTKMSRYFTPSGQ